VAIGWAQPTPEELIRRLVVAGLAASIAIHQPVFAQAHVNYRLAEHTILLALARALRLLALRTPSFGRTCFGTHIANASAAACKRGNDLRNARRRRIAPL